MDRLDLLQKTKAELLHRIASLDDMRRGSVVPQFYSGKLKDGTKVKRGPYLLYSYKDAGRTVSRRLPDAETAQQYEDQIEQLRQFSRLCAELVEVSHEICDLKMRTSEPKGDSPS